MNIYKVVGDNIRGFRQQKGWTQEKLGVRAEMNVNYIGCIERAEKKVILESLLKIAETLKVRPDLLLVKESYKSNVSV